MGIQDRDWYREQMKERELEKTRAKFAGYTHPSLVKRMQSSGWDHNLVRHLMIEYFAKATMGEAWDKPTTEQLLEVASQMMELPA